MLHVVQNGKHKTSLNPYSDGRWFLVAMKSRLVQYAEGLNPYSDGRWFLMELKKRNKPENLGVLILILMEDGF